MKSRLLRMMSLLFAISILAAACGDSDDDDTSSTTTEAAATTEAPTTTEGDDGGETTDTTAAPSTTEVAATLEPETDTLRICQAPSFSGLPAHIAVTQGLLADKGITGEFIQCPSGPANAAALASGQVDVVGNTPDNMLGLRNADFDVVMFGQAIDTHFFDILVRSDIDVACDQGDWECTMTALDGMNVGVVARGAAAELIARALLSDAGLDPENSTYIATGLSGTTLAALSSGEIDWAITFEPGLSQGVVDGIGHAPFSLRNGDGPDSLDWPSLVLTTSRSFYDANPNAIEIYRQTIVEAMDWIRDDANRAAVLEEMNAFIGVEGAVAEAILDNNVGSFTMTGDLDRDRLTANAQFAFDNGRIPEVYDFEEYAVGPGIVASIPAALVPETSDIRICQAPAFTGMGAHIAVTRGFLSDRGVNGEFIQCPSGPANAAALVGGDVEFVGNTPDNMLGLRNADFDVVMFGQAVDRHFFDIIVSNDFEIDCEQGDWECTMQALDGTNVGVVARGAAAEQIARELYDQAGLDPDDATYIATGLSGTTLAALSSGEVDWAITFEPGLSQGEIDGIGYLPFALRSGDGPATLNWPSLVLTTSREFFDANPNTVAIYKAAIRDAYNFMRNPANRADVLSDMNDLLGVEGELAEKILDDNIASISLNVNLQRARIEANVAYAVGRGILDESIPYEDFTVDPG